MCVFGQQSQQQQQQQQQQHHHKMGGRSSSGLEELIMGCTSTTDIKEVSFFKTFLTPRISSLYIYIYI